VMKDFYEAQLGEAFALRDGVVLDANKFPEVVVKGDGNFEVGSWIFTLEDDGDTPRVLADLHAWASWYRFLISRTNQEQRRVTGG
jgi:hypothetical protein